MAVFHGAGESSACRKRSFIQFAVPDEVLKRRFIRRLLRFQFNTEALQVNVDGLGRCDVARLPVAFQIAQLDKFENCQCPFEVSIRCTGLIAHAKGIPLPFIRKLIQQETGDAVSSRRIASTVSGFGMLLIGWVIFEHYSDRVPYYL